VLDPAVIAGLRQLDPGGQSRLIQRVVTAFESSTDRLVPHLIESHRRGDMAGIRHVAHTLKSSAASVGGAQLSAICAELEALVRQEQHADLKPRIDALVAESKVLLNALRQLTEARE
jgi:HPt (histidine-containing phosphotransfer) domain-containing protein